MVVLLAFPLVLAGVLGGVRIASSLSEIQSLNAVQSHVALVERVATAVDSLQTERKLSAAAATTQDPAEQALVDQQISRVDADVANMIALAPDAGTLEDDSAAAYVEVLRSLGETSIPSSGNTLPKLRELVAAPDTSIDTVMSLYTDVIAILLKFNRIALGGTGAEEDSLVTAFSYMSEAKEQASVQHALLLAASLEGEASASQQTQLRNSIAGFDAAITNFSEVPISSEQRRVYFDTYSGRELDDRERFLNIGLGELDSAPLDSIATDWDAVSSTIQTMLGTVQTSLIDDVKESLSAATDVAVNDAIRDAVIIALLLLFTLILLVLVARSVLRPLLALRTSALDVAQRRLPDLVEQLRKPGGWKDNPASEPVAVHTNEDIGQVARAFDEVHREAVRLATEQAMMRSTVNDMFVNLSRRSQSMVERQLRIIDSLESGERDPEALGELFRLDHLATRMRRNNENLLVLAGSETRQRAGAARPVLDILRGAISEIEEYRRITIESVPDVSVQGIAVNDLVHLTAELLDNATNFSPKEAQVVLASSITPDGSLVIEIRDLGVGMSATQRKAINERLAVPPMVDVSISRHMGLFVVGRLASRHGLVVRMQATGESGGLTAAISVPSNLLAGDDMRPAAPARPAEVSGNGPNVPAKTGSLWDAARNVAPIPAAAQPSAAKTGSLWDAARNVAPVSAEARSGPNEARNGRPIPAGTGALSDAQDPPSGAPGSDPLFAAAAASTLDVTSNGLARAGQGQDLFAAAVPVGEQSTDFFGDLSLGETASPEPAEATPIFQEMRSAWFRQWPGAAGADQQDASEQAGASAAVEPAADFGSAADEGWQAVQVLRAPVEAGVTTAGLPRRRPRANLVPGATSRATGEAAASSPARLNNLTPLRDAERVRGNLSSYQRGTRRGRHSSPMEDSDRAGGDPTRNGMGRHGELPTSRERQ